jgi:hypothetical protein
MVSNPLATLVRPIVPLAKYHFPRSRLFPLKPSKKSKTAFPSLTGLGGVW